jgi:hypothetical protein
MAAVSLLVCRWFNSALILLRFTPECLAYDLPQRFHAVKPTRESPQPIQRANRGRDEIKFQVERIASIFVDRMACIPASKNSPATL